MGDQNPWVVESIEAFSFYCCPECDLKTKSGDYFKRHAIECHNKSKVFFIMLKPGNTTNKDPLGVETEFEFQEGIEKGMEKLGEGETSVNEESLSESEWEVKKSEHKSQIITNGPDLESIDDYETSDFFDDNVNTIDDQETESNFEELETFDHDLESEDNKEQAKIFDEGSYIITEVKNILNKEEKKRKRDLDIEREKKKKKLKAILDMEDTEVDPVDFEHRSHKKIAKSLPHSKTHKTDINTPKSTKDYLTLDEKLEMRAILEKEDTEAEEDSSVEIENDQIQDCLGDGSNPNLIAKFGSDSATDEESDQASNKKLKKISKSMPCPKIWKKRTRNKLTLEEKLEIIRLRDNGVSTAKICKDKNMAESSVRTLYSRRENIKFQATLANPSQHSAALVIKTERTRSMEKMEGLLSLWVQNLDQRGVIVGRKQIKTKAKSLYFHTKKNFEDKTEAEIKETFGASNGWFYNYIKRHDIKIEKQTGRHYVSTPLDLTTVHEKIKEHKCEMCHQKFPLINALADHIKTVHEEETSFLQKQNLSDYKKEVLMKIKAFKCKDCGKNFSSKLNMESHEKRVHCLIKPSQKYTCNECKTPFEEIQQMEWHINSVHMNEKPYKCNLCEDSFFIDSQLKQHLKKTHRICEGKISLFE